jgi:hypothetical protein
MKKFWKWMKENDYGWEEENVSYGGYWNDYGLRVGRLCDNWVLFTQQMLIGYMQEYLLVNGFISFRQFGIWLAEQTKERRFWKAGVILDGDNHMEVIYDILKQKIEELE